jgi:flagellar basal body-associated protein FliL
MATAAASERPSGGGSSAALRSPAPPERLLSPAGYLAVAVGMVVAMVLVMRATAAFQEPGGPGPSHDTYDEVDLGQVNWDLSPEATGLVREPFMLRIIVVLNPKVRDLAALKLQVERRRNLFRDIMWSEILSTKTEADLRKPAVVEAMKAEIRQRLNAELGGPRDGQEMIDRVIFPDRKLPERR